MKGFYGGSWPSGGAGLGGVSKEEAIALIHRYSGLKDRSVTIKEIESSRAAEDESDIVFIKMIDHLLSLEDLRKRLVGHSIDNDYIRHRLDNIIDKKTIDIEDSRFD